VHQIVGRVNQGELTIVQLKEIPSSDLLVELSAFGDAPSASTAAVSPGAGSVSSAASSSPSPASLPSTAAAALDTSQPASLPSTAAAALGTSQVDCLLRPANLV
jgi:hypothetical protein